MADNNVQLEVFEGPLDLLLYLVRRNEVDIYEVNLTQMAKQFVQYVEVMRDLNLDIAGEFLVMAATLMYIKSKELLPKEKQAVVDDEPGGDDPRFELIRQLIQYKKFKDASGRLQEKEREQELIYPRVAPRPDFAVETQGAKVEVSIFDLVNAVSSILKRHAAKGRTSELFEEAYSVSEKIEMLGAMVRGGRRLRFADLFQDATTRGEVVVTFLALLELIRLKKLRVEQAEPFAEIEISEANPPPPLPSGAPATLESQGPPAEAATPAPPAP